MTSQSPVDEGSAGSFLHPSSTNDVEMASLVEVATPGGDQVAQYKRGRKRNSEEKEENGEHDNKRMVTPIASSLERPSRERKSVERFSDISSGRISATKALSINQGLGEKLRDIPNAAFKLSKRKADESLQVLHRVLFGRKANVHFLKRNILQFSGFVWSENEDKEKSKLKEKLNKCNKDRLLDFCDLLDIHTMKVATKKEDISAKLFEFLESPHCTREDILVEKRKKGKKRRLRAKRTDVTLEVPAKQKKKKKGELKGNPREELEDPAHANEEVKGKNNSVDKSDESSDEEISSDGEETSELSKDEAHDEKNEHEPESTEKFSNVEGIDGDEELESKQNASAVGKVSLASSKMGPPSPIKADIESESKNTSRSKTSTSKDTQRRLKSVQSNKGMQSSKKKADAEDESKISSARKQGFPKDVKGSSKMKTVKIPVKIDSNDSSKRKFSMKVVANSGTDDSIRSKKGFEKKETSDIGTASKKSKGSKKQSEKKEYKNPAKKQEKEPEKDKNISIVPSGEQLSAAVSDILKEVDFNVATLADIIKQLGVRFDTDLMHRKTEIKWILQEEINNMTDDDVDDGDDSGGSGDGDGDVKDDKN